MRGGGTKKPIAVINLFRFPLGSVSAGMHPVFTLRKNILVGCRLKTMKGFVMNTKCMFLSVEKSIRSGFNPHYPQATNYLVFYY